MENWVDPNAGGEVQFIRSRSDLFQYSVGTDKPIVQFIGGARHLHMLSS
jgi:hypothetical protein